MNNTTQIDIFKMIIEDNLPDISTAQTINASKTGKERVDAYMVDIRSGKAGYMGIIKNIRTMLENDISDQDLQILIDFITNTKMIKKSMILPFRFVDAWNSIKDLTDYNEIIESPWKQQLELAFFGNDKKSNFLKMQEKLKFVKKALEDAFTASAENVNIANDGEKVAILLDESCSMGGGRFLEKKKQPFYIGKVLTASLKMNINKDDCLFYTWADTCTKREINDQSPFDFIQNLYTKGGGTDVSAPLRKLIKTKTKVDSIIILTDMQLYGGYGGFGDQVKNYINQYRKEVNPNAKILFWNLQGYDGGAPIDLEKTQEIFEVSGYSDHMLQVIPNIWNNKDFLIEEIESIQL